MAEYIVEDSNIDYLIYNNDLDYLLREREN